MLFLLYSLFAFAADPNGTPSADSEWKALLHYEGDRSSVAPSAEFFLSKNGSKDPDAELEATKNYFLANPAEAHCRFPARAVYLRKKFSIETLPNCERLQKWLDAMSPKAVELVYASAYLESPSSMYGHTLLKFPRRGKTEGEDLLDYTLSFGADTGKVLGLPYVWMGLTGAFHGYFATAPFYLKVKEYNFVENRDFYTYEIKLTPQELELLTLHIWEMRNVPFPYFFLHKNCSYFLLELLEVVRPGSNFTAHFPFWAVPMDTVRLLNDNGLLGEGVQRPSRNKILEAYTERLSRGERAQVAAFVERGVSLSPEASALQWETAYQWHRYRTEGKAQQSAALEQMILQERAQAKGELPKLDWHEPSPEQGHATGRWSVSGGRSADTNFGELSYRAALHDLLSDPLGYEKYSELSMGDIRLRWQKKVFLENFTVLHLRSVAPSSDFSQKWAWEFHTGFERLKRPNCEAWKCLAGVMRGGYGKAAKLGPLLVFALWQLQSEVGPALGHSFRLSTGPGGGVALSLSRTLHLLTEGGRTWSFWGDRGRVDSLKLAAAWQGGREWELRSQIAWSAKVREASLGFYFYPR